MLRLHTLGRLSLASGDTNRAGAASRRRSLALLALAASSGDSGIEDENALALLWPEFDSQRARNNLKQVCFSLRQGLGPDAFVRSGTTLRIDPAKLSVDLWDFQRAATKGTPEAAVELYTGPFLSGFNLPGLPDFERWAETERARIAQLNVSALEMLASTALASADHNSAVRWWRQLVMQNQFNDVYSQNLIKSLVAAGDIGGALQHVRVHESLLQQELDVKPSSEFQQFVCELRRVYAAANATVVVFPTNAANQPAPVTASERTTRDHPSPLPAANLTLAASGIAEQNRDFIQPILPDKPERAGPDEPREARASHGKRLFRIGLSNWAAAVVVLVVAVAGFARFADRPVDAAAVTTAVVVLPFAGDGGNAASTMGATVTALLATSLDGSMGLRVLPAVKGGTDIADSLRPQPPLSARNARQLAAKAGASLYVTGQVVENGGSIRITAELRSRQRDDALELVVAEGDGRELFDLVDRVASQILASRIEGGRREVVRVASVTTASLPAAKAYFTAEEAFRAGRFRTAVDSYTEALRLDSAFALAEYGLSGAAEMLGDEELARRSATAAQRHASNLPRRQRRLLTAYLARQRGDVTTADRVYSQLTADYPTDGDAWMGLAEARFHLNALRGRPAAESRDAFERATALDSTNASAFVHLARIATLENDGDKSRRMIARARTVAADDALERMALHVLSLGDPLMNTDPSERLAAAGSRGPTALELLSRRGTDEWRAFATGFTSPSAPQRVRAYGLRLASLVAASRGCIAESLALLDECSEANRSIALEARARLAVLAFIPFDSKEIRRLRDLVNGWTPDDHPTDDPIDSLSHANAHPSLRLHLLGLLSLRLNDTAAVEQLARELDAMANGLAEWTANRLAASLRAHLAASRGQPIEALALLEGAAGNRLASASSAEAYDRLLHAQLLEQLGREDEALGYYREFGEYSPFDLPLIWQAELGMARIYASQGDRLLAARYYRSVANRLKDADLPLRGSAHVAALRAADMEMR